jgi:hypothetical protein
LEIASQLLKLYPNDFASDQLNRLIVNQKVYEALRQGAEGRALRQIWEADLSTFRSIRNKYLLY